MLVVGLSACSKMEPESTVDPLPLPQEIETNKDLSVKPGDSFLIIAMLRGRRRIPFPLRDA